VRSHPVRAARSDEIEEMLAGAFPGVSTRRLRISNYEGAAAGRVAADQADLAAALSGR
jgi:hypothetical protein